MGEIIILFRSELQTETLPRGSLYCYKVKAGEVLAVSCLNLCTLQVSPSQHPWLLVTFIPVCPVHSRPHRVYFFSNCKTALLLITKSCNGIISIPPFFIRPMWRHILSAKSTSSKSSMFVRLSAWPYRTWIIFLLFWILFSCLEENAQI